MEKLIGFYKELDDDEKLLKESPNLVEMYEKRGLSFLGIFRPKAFRSDPDTSFAKLFLTNKNLIFLTLFVGNLKELKSGKGDVSGIVTEWSFIPLSQITKLEAPKAGFFDVLFKKSDEKDRGQLIIHYGKSELSIVLAQRDMWKAVIEEYSHNLAHKVNERKAAEYEEGKSKAKFVCPICGTTYKKDGIKIVVCPHCGREICREKKGGSLFSPKWEITGCFIDEKFICRHCSTKKK